jgi:hypothetical protein
MRSIRSLRVLAVIASAGMLVGALGAAPAHGKKKKPKPTCPAFTSAVEGAEEAETLVVTPKATEAKPLEQELEFAPALPLNAEHFFTNVQSLSPKHTLNIRLEFDGDSDIDLYLYDEAGEEVASSGAFNPAPIPGVTDAGGNGGSGFESIPDFAASQCAGYTIESASYMTPGTAAILKVWLAK